MLWWALSAGLAAGIFAGFRAGRYVAFRQLGEFELRRRLRQARGWRDG